MSFKSSAKNIQLNIQYVGVTFVDANFCETRIINMLMQLPVEFLLVMLEISIVLRTRSVTIDFRPSIICIKVSRSVSPIDFASTPAKYLFHSSLKKKNFISLSKLWVYNGVCFA